MGIEIKELIISKRSAAAESTASAYVPPNGAILIIESFNGESGFSTDTVVRLEWNGVIIWTTKGSGKMPFEKVIDDCDGTKKLALIVDNGINSSIYLSAYVKFQERT